MSVSYNAIKYSKDLSEFLETESEKADKALLPKVDKPDQ